MAAILLPKYLVEFFGVEVFNGEASNQLEVFKELEEEICKYNISPPPPYAAVMQSKKSRAQVLKVTQKRGV